MPSPTDRIRAVYRIETAHPVERAAAAIAGEQSTGTFVRVPGETDALRDRFGARVEQIVELDETEVPALPGSHPPKGSVAVRYRRAEVTVSWPFENIGPSLPQLAATVMGNLYELGELSGCRLLELDLPPAFGDAYPGPQFGIAGTRALAGIEGRPLIGTIVKPSVGLSAEETAALVRTLVEAGLDFIKDDELTANPPHTPLAERVRAVMAVINEHADRTGRKAMYAFNITGELDEMARGHDTVLNAGGTCVMVSLHSIGLTGLSWIRQRSQLPLHCHRNGWGMFGRSPYLGVDFPVMQQLWRLAGADHLHVNGLRNKFCESDESVIRSARSCLEPLFGGNQAMPVFSSGQWAGQAPDTYTALGSADLMYLCGGGIIAHPGGIAAGVASVRQGWEAALSGTSLVDYAHDHAELRQAMEKYG
jgi:ribulose-bisphosphate carboxylase large chain